MSNKISMQYPLDASGNNELFDGQTHNIEPIAIRRIEINGREFFVLDYYDHSMGVLAITLLIRMGSLFVKVPLSDYDALFTYLDTHEQELLQLSDVKLPDKIPLAQTLQPEYLFGNTNKPDDIYTFENYVPLTSNGNGIARDGAYSLSYVRIESFSDDEQYVFSKEANYPLKDIGIQEGISNWQLNEDGIPTYSFQVKVPPYTVGTVAETHNDGRTLLRQVYIIPGIHEYQITYGFCRTNEEYAASRRASSIVMEADYNDYKGLKDKKRAFFDGCKGTLPTDYYNADKKRISTNKNGFGI